MTDHRTPNEVVINLDMTVPSNVKDITELIQQRALGVMLAKITKRADWLAKNAADSQSSDSQIPFAKLYSKGWTGFIDGTRGAGKSTFMQVLLSRVKEAKLCLTVFDMIDPNKTEPVEVLLLIILVRIRSKVEERFKETQQSESKIDNENKWRRCFKNVAGGLALLNEDHKPLKDLEPDLFLDLGLERAGDSAKLREHLHDLFKCATEILGTKALLFAFDDADIHAKTAIQLLETIRKYLDTPLVMVLVTGDMELYSLLAREHMKGTLSFDFLKQSFVRDPDHDERMPQKLRMLSHLEEQYLLKLFPLNDRIHLRTIKYLLEDDDGWSYFLTHEIWKGKLKNKELGTYVYQLIQHHLHLKSKDDVKLYCDFFLSQPVRGIVQVLSQTVRADTDTDVNSKDGSLDFFEASLDFTLQSLYHFDFDTDALLENDLRVLFAAVFKIGILDGNPDTSAYLRPLSADPHIQAAMLSLSAAVAQQLKGKPGDCIAYILRGPGMVKLFSMYPHTTSENSNANPRQHNIHPKDYEIEQDHAQREFRRYMEIGRSEKALGCARLATVLLAHLQSSKTNPPAIDHGVCEIDLETEEQKIKASADSNEGRIHASAFCLVQSSGTGTRTFASILNMLGLVSRLLTHAQSQDWQKKAPKVKEKIVEDLLVASFINSVIVSAPPWLVKRDGTPITRSASLNNKTRENAKLIKPWLIPLVTWMDCIHPRFSEIRPSSVFLGKVWTRLFFSLEIASDAAREEQNESEFNLFNSMELFALCAIHAFLLEEFAYHQLGDATSSDTNHDEPQETIHIDNPKDKTVYLHQLNQCKQTLFGKDVLGKKLPLTWIVATCPLMEGLIKDPISGTQWPWSLGYKTTSSKASRSKSQYPHYFSKSS
jgi:hypothetical protein